MIRVPDEFAVGTAEREGEPGAAWLRELPGIVEALLERWRCEPDGPVQHGSVGIVVPVRRSSPPAGAMLKVSFPHPGNVHEPDAFAAWQGHGAVALYQRDDSRFAMLLERAQEVTLASVEDDDEFAACAGLLSGRLAIRAPGGLPRLSDQAGDWAEQLRLDARELGHLVSARAVGAAVATARELGERQPDTVVHGDFHARNILRAVREPWLAVDPKGYAGDPAYDGGTFVKTCLVKLLNAGDPVRRLNRILDVFAESAGLDRDRIQRWTQFRLVHSTFWDRRHQVSIGHPGSRLRAVNDLAGHLTDLLTDGR
jgi:streptomycin 6-kinase